MHQVSGLQEFDKRLGLYVFYLYIAIRSLVINVKVAYLCNVITIGVLRLHAGHVTWPVTFTGFEFRTSYRIFSVFIKSVDRKNLVSVYVCALFIRNDGFVGNQASASDCVFVMKYTIRFAIGIYIPHTGTRTILVSVEPRPPGTIPIDTTNWDEHKHATYSSWAPAGLRNFPGEGQTGRDQV